MILFCNQTMKSLTKSSRFLHFLRPSKLRPSFSQTKPTKFTSSFCSPDSHHNGTINSQSPTSSVHPKPGFRIAIHSPIPPGFAQSISFLSTKSDPSPPSTIPVVSTVNSPLEKDSPSLIDAGSSIRKPISLWPGMYHSPVTNALWEARSRIYEKPVNVPSDNESSTTTSQKSELMTKTPAQSRTSILYKFSEDLILREQYRNFCNEIRIGNLLEDLDALAGTISFKHCCDDRNMTRPLLLVTASVDKMALKKRFHVDRDLKIVGAVTWVGRSSMEIQLEVTQSEEGSPALVANFTFVARDSTTGKSAPVNQISPETEREILLWKEAEERNMMRKNKKGQHKRDMENGKVERLKALLAEGRILCDMPALANRDSILIRDTCLQNSLICQPQQRNIYGRIFGGFLMHRAFELAFSTAYVFAGTAPRFLEVDHVDFLSPVDVGDFLRFKSCVLYTDVKNLAQPQINVEVVAHVTRPELRATEVSNKFYFTFTVHPEAVKSRLTIRNVFPTTEEEALRVLERMDAETADLAIV